MNGANMPENQEVANICEEYASKFPPLITLDQAAAIAQVPIGTIYDWSSRGRFDAFKRRVGREVRLFRDPFIRTLLMGFEFSAE
jgi:hypothetical protein